MVNHVDNNTLAETLDFVVVGAQKSGTTWLHECLNEHPEIFVPARKELHFFCPNQQCRYSTRANGLAWYLSQLKKKSEKIAGELSTDYMFYPGIAKELSQLHPKLKILILLRNPVDRAYSAYWMWRRHNESLGDFQGAIQTHESLLQRGLYWRQVEPFVQHFGSSNVHVQIYEELFSDPDVKLAEIYSWLGVSAGYRAKVAHKKIGNTSVYPAGVGRVIYKGLSRILNMRMVMPIWRQIRRHSRLKERMISAVGRLFGGTDYPRLPDQMRAELSEYYRSENLLLEQYLNRKEAIWK